MATDEVIRSTCRLCSIGCGILAHVDNGQVIKITGDPQSPLNKGVLCPKGLASLEYLYHPDRLLHPQKRVGKKGEGKWQPVSWDEALDMIAGELKRVKTKYGAKSFTFIRGSFKGSYQDELLARFANVYGSPNLMATSHVCHVPRANAALLTYGFWSLPDYDFPPASMVVWGINMVETKHHGYRRFTEAIERGAKVMIIDPRKIKGADKANLWLRLRPGSDLALALAMINVIINEKLYDSDFVNNWTVGFDQLKAHIQDYSPEKVAEITWIDAETIRKAARFYAANKPAVIIWGNALDHTLNNFQTGRALCILRAITGNLEIPGGELNWLAPPILQRTSPSFTLPNKISPEVRAQRITVDEKPLPIYFSALPQGILKAIRYGDPYPVRSAYMQGCNPLLVYSNVQEAYRAFLALDFFVVADTFMNPTAALADLVLPVTSYLEADAVVVPSDDSIALVQQRVTRLGECRTEYEILRDLARRLGLGEYFEETEKKYLDSIMAPAGLTFDEFRKVCILPGKKQYRSYQSGGFATPSGKVELYSNRLQEWGFDPLPIFREPPETPFSAPEMVSEYPLILTTWKSAEFRHSEERQIPSLRRSHPEPVTYINPQTAAKLGIADGDWIYIETKRGRITQKAILSPDTDPRMVVVDYGWWFPEDDPAEMYGWTKSNVNILTSDQPPFSREMGTPNLRGMLCKVYKA